MYLDRYFSLPAQYNYNNRKLHVMNSLEAINKCEKKIIIEIGQLFC